ncbi:MAG: CpaE family protein [Methyloligellaceae bacterium]
MLGKFKADRNQQHIPVELVAADARLKQLVHETLERDERFAVSSRFSSIDAAENAGFADTPPSILLVELDPAQPGDLAALDRLMQGAASAAHVIPIIDSLTESAVRRLLHLHVSDLLSKASSPEDLLKACERAVNPERSRGRFAGATFYAFVSAGGGAGNTTLAIQSAFVLARKTGQFQSTCLVDMDFQCGAVADYVDVTPNLQLDEVAPSPDRLDTQLLEVMLSRHETGLAVLAADNALRPYDEVSQDLVARLLDMASMKFDSVVLDMPRVWLPWSEAVLRGSDRVFIVTEMTVPGLRQARRLLDAIRAQCGDETDISVIVNRFRQSLLGGINAVKKRDAEQLFAGHLAGFVSEDYRLVREAIDRGVPLCQIEKNHRILKDLEEILCAERTQVSAAPAPAPARSRA